MSSPDHQATPVATTLERRLYPRFVPQTPIFFTFNGNEAEASQLLNVSENGFLLSTPTGLPCNFVTRLSIPLNGLPKPVRVLARVAWASGTGKLAGIQLLDLNKHDREQIRKWGAHESTRSPQPESVHRSLDASLFINSELPHFIPAFAKGTPLNTPPSTSPDIAALAFSPLIRKRLAFDVDRRAIRLMFIAMACLIAAVVVIKAAPFARSNSTSPESIAARPPVQEMEPASQTPPISDRAPNTQAPSLAPSDDAASSKHTPVAGMHLRHNSAKTGEVPGKTASDDNPANTQSDLSLTIAVPAPTGTAPDGSNVSSESSALAGVPKEASEAEAPLSPDPPTPKQPVPGRTLASDASSAPATIPSHPSSSPSSRAPSNAPVAPARSVLSPNSVAPVIQMDSPRDQTLEVPNGHSGSLSLPGERLLESPSLTTNIQRSLLMPPTHAVWPFRRKRKVFVGELISHVAPQFAQPANSRAVSFCVKATIAKDGRIENVKQVLGPPNMGPAVAKALGEWRYQPTLVDGKPVETQSYITFQLRPTPYHAARR